MFKTIFGNKQPPQSTTYYKMLNDYVPIYTPFDGEIYDSDVGRTCIDAIAKNAAKLKPKHIRRVNGKIVRLESELERLLAVRPNEYMNTYDFLYKVVSQLYSHNNSFIYIRTDNRGIVTGLYPINFSSLEMVDYQGELYCRFTFRSGFRMTVPYTDLIHLRRHFNRDDIFGEDGRMPLKATLNLIQTINQGIINAIKSSARLRGWLKFTSTLRPEDLKAQRDQFVNDYLGVSNDGGIGALDAKADFTPAKLEAQMADDKQMQIVRENAYRYFGVSEKIVQSSYNEDEFNAFYASVLEPIAIQLSLEFTAKLFTHREKGFGNEIVFSASRLMYAANATKVAMAKELMPMGIFTINEMREVFELEPVADGDKRLQTLNVVSADKANQYQVGEVGDPNGQGNKGN
jgi:HK97 family phage portal protein